MVQFPGPTAMSSVFPFFACHGSKCNTRFMAFAQTMRIGNKKSSWDGTVQSFVPHSRPHMSRIGGNTCHTVAQNLTHIS